jgi:hypothetical protein
MVYTSDNFILVFRTSDILPSSQYYRIRQMLL